MRKSAEERRTEVVRAALRSFSRYGFHGTSTDSIARAIGVSQPYLFRLYPTKRDIFLAAGRSCFERTSLAFNAAAEGLTGEEALNAMRRAYGELAGDRELLLMQLQLYVASSSDEELRDEVTRWWDDLWLLVAQLTSLPPEDINQFMSCGMLINVMVALGISDGHQGWDVLLANLPGDGAAPSGDERPPEPLRLSAALPFPFAGSPR
ncbi:TetR/AcrR family transcriptional regulator [Streptomyces bohaiensis]|uniref:TetR/AcrR family transcriptional regulator n=1 Tax=Streptomyces bohaiensis TaxID=1431344 RepID=A0ABX1C4Z3_9ACTN|nr:TetR/AcrR family transcriptional regulator [Streptomyces bohaiensis]NJQ14280.1 TetR/AcrR family transcriptional regulator [Streptomyces bohaiensis]